MIVARKKQWVKPDIIPREILALRLAQKLLESEYIDVCPGCGLLGEALRKRHARDPYCDMQLFYLLVAPQ